MLNSPHRYDLVDPPVSIALATPTRSVSDDIVARAQAGDEDAFSALYSQHRKRVLHICFRMVHDLSQAEDLTQETFLQVYRKLKSFRGKSAFTTWLHRVTVNTVLMHIRRRVLLAVSLNQTIVNQCGEHKIRDFGAVDLLQCGTVDRTAIERAAIKLAPGYRNAFLLFDVNGFQHHEIASILGCSVGNSKSQLYRARRELRRSLSAPRMM